MLIRIRPINSRVQATKATNSLSQGNTGPRATNASTRPTITVMTVEATSDTTSNAPITTM